MSVYWCVCVCLCLLMSTGMSIPCHSVIDILFSTSMWQYLVLKSDDALGINVQLHQLLQVSELCRAVFQDLCKQLLIGPDIA